MSAFETAPPLPDGLTYRLTPHGGLWTVDAIRTVTVKRLFGGTKEVEVEVDSVVVPGGPRLAASDAVLSAARVLHERRTRERDLREIARRS